MLTIKHGMLIYSWHVDIYLLILYSHIFCIKLFIYFYISNNKSICPTLPYTIRKDILTFAITEFSDVFTKTMNRDDVSFKSQYILEKLDYIDKDFTFNITHDLNIKVLTGIDWMTSYMRNNVERFGNYLSINAMRSYISNTT